jgi:hypothetical protein
MNELYKHEESGANLFKPVAFPKINNFQDLFPLSTTDKANFPAEKTERLTMKDGKEKMYIGTYCILPDHNSCRVAISDCVLTFIKTNMILINYDELFFEVVDHKNGWCLILVSYGQIIGNRWLAYVKKDSIPCEIRKEWNKVQS